MRARSLALLGLLFTAAAAAAQAPAGVYAITSACLEIGDGTVVERGTVVIRGDRIEAVGAEVLAPPEAEVIPGDGLTVYPGFIDGLSSAGLTLPAAVAQQDDPPDTSAEAPAAMREANRTAIRPELRAAAHLALTDAQLIPLRQAGFTTAHIAPTGGILDGVGAVVNLGGRPRREAVVSAQALMHAGFRGRGVYPGSLMGIFAHFRQTLLDAQRYRRMQDRFRGSGGPRPPSDEALEALQPVLDGELAVLWDADTPKEIRRAVGLADEFRFKLMVAGGTEAWKVAPLLAERKIPVVVAVNFPAEPPATRPASDLDTPPEVIRERRRLWQEQVANAVRLREAGVRIAFTTRGTRNPAEFMTQLRKVIAAGLPREAALQALTRDAAALLGVDREVGTIAPGKTANLAVLTAPFADPSAKARWMFIDGRKFQPERERVPAAPPTTPARPADDEEAHG